MAKTVLRAAWALALGALLALAPLCAFASNITSLPVLTVTQGVGTDEDFALGLAFSTSTGASANLSGLSFTATISALNFTYPGTTLATVTGSISNNNLLTFYIPAAAKASWPTGVYWLTVTATDGVSTRDLVSIPSSVTVGSASAPTLAQQDVAGGFIASLTTPQIPSGPVVASACGFNTPVLVVCAPLFGGLF